MDQKIVKEVLDNGLTVLLKKTDNKDNVAISLWYAVGAKDDTSSHRGYAHLLEHMIFKGTRKLSETDIIDITHKLSGYCNASTTYDYTRYDFQFPAHQWTACLDIFSDCMVNCKFKQDYLNSEFKAVIQEIKMTEDDYSKVLTEKLLSMIFETHPYHYPITGTKQDIMNSRATQLQQFYDHYYIPENATLTVVGDISLPKALHAIHKAFNPIKKKKKPHKYSYDIIQDISSKSITLYRTVVQPQVQLAFIIPGFSEKNHHLFESIGRLLFNGTSARLYKKLVCNLGLAHSLEASTLDLFEKDLFIIQCNPYDPQKNKEIIQLIIEELESLSIHGISEEEQRKLSNSYRTDYYQLLEDNKEQNNAIGASFLAKKDEYFKFKTLTRDFSHINQELCNVMQAYFRPSLVHQGFLKIANQEEHEDLLKFNDQQDRHDIKDLHDKIRSLPKAAVRAARHVTARSPHIVRVPHFTKSTLLNGLTTILAYKNTVPLILVKLNLKVTARYEPAHLPGLYNFLLRVLFTGSTKSQSYSTIVHKLEAMGTIFKFSEEELVLTVQPDHLEESLLMLASMIGQPKFDELEIECIRQQLLYEHQEFWQDSAQISEYLVKKRLYGEPIQDQSRGTFDSLNNISKQDLINFYEQCITPQQAALFIVGDLPSQAKKIISTLFRDWTGPQLKKMTSLKPGLVTYEDISYDLAKEQLRLTYAGLSLARKDPQFDALELLEEILTAPMKGKLFQIRESTGLFYSIEGSFSKNASADHTYFMISTLIYKENAPTLERELDNLLATIADTITQEDVEQAKNVLLHSYSHINATSSQLLETLSYLHSQKKGKDYYLQKAKKIRSLQRKDVQAVARKIFTEHPHFKVKVGPIK